MRFILVVFLACLALSTTSAAADERPRSRETDVLVHLRSEHPRLLVLDDDLPRIQRLIERDETVSGWFNQLRAAGEQLLREPPVQHDPKDPIGVARRVLLRVTTLAGLHRLSDDRRFADRCRTELLAAAGFPDWGARHSFLAVAEMTTAVAIGYDWLYPILPNRERDALETAIIEKSWKPAERAYAGKAFWTAAAHNWNPVCNAGVTMGALAIAERDPARAARLVRRAVRSVPVALRSLAPAGGWEEGPGYWNYATRYAAIMIAGLTTATGDDFDLPRQPGFDDAGRFRIYTTGPTGNVFNFADGGEGAEIAPQMFWMATVLARPEYAAYERALRGVMRAEPSMLDVMWFNPAPDRATRDLPLDAAFDNLAVGVAAFRSGWDDPDATYVAFKGGSNQAHHGHLDLGTFVLDALGRRWAAELGADRYTLPRYNDAGDGGRRWRYYRTGTVGQNTLVIEGENQDPDAGAPLIAFQSTPGRAHAVADLTAGYREHARRVRRGVALLDRRDVLVQDEVEPRSSRRTRDDNDRPRWQWQMHTRADVRVLGGGDVGTTARLTLDGRTLEARVLSPEGAAFDVQRPKPPAPQRSLDEYTKLLVRVPDARRSFRVAVLFTPVGEEAPSPRLEPLDDWVAQANRSKARKPP